MKKIRMLALGCALALSIGTAAGCGEPAAETPVVSPADTPVVEEPADTLILPTGTEKNITEYDGYSLIWNDEFSGTELDRDKWNPEKHNPGYTNQELQEYTNSPSNIYVEDGVLVLRALKTERFGKDYYTSGKVNNRNKCDFTYGKVVVSAKVPEGQGLWPAIWMMPADQGKYGTWPKCGEIDIMEILGHQVDTAHTTIHYGDPHAQQQGTIKLEEGTFADGFHEYCLEWEPGEIRFYVDGNHTITCNDWFTAFEGGEEKPFPAPFDQDFYLQLNLAVGGTWPGNPDETTDFENAKFLVDYVRVYQKPEYDTNVTRPEKEYREPNEDGNYINNGDFSEAEELSDNTDWSFMLFNGGKAAAEIKDNTMVITTENEGTVDYAVQLVQADLPILNGKTYRVSFDAASNDTRDLIVCVSAPNNNYARYLQDTKVTVTPDWQTFTYEFTMSDRDDPAGRLEFNMGLSGSTADVYLRNVRVEQVG